MCNMFAYTFYRHHCFHRAEHCSLWSSLSSSEDTTNESDLLRLKYRAINYTGFAFLCDNLRISLNFTKGKFVSHYPTNYSCAVHIFIQFKNKIISLHHISCNIWLFTNTEFVLLSFTTKTSCGKKGHRTMAEL